MNIYSGLDLVEVPRFNLWYSYSCKSLSRVFHPHEQLYCLSKPSLSAQRFAVRFATKEAFYKALSKKNGGKAPVPLLTLLPLVWIEKTEETNAPILKIDWDNLHLPADYIPDNLDISLTHTTSTAGAIVTLIYNRAE
ncbi:4'-phosphopantetheinyl transferase superfamily protein [Vermiphilus pyriformis]|jgi:phosphopantetheine--protein transferase-like protein|nr:MAG: 4'-phosphopantetheinyl transferase superfamily protein [Vermiphilus pyriformis]